MQYLDSTALGFTTNLTNKIKQTIDNSTKNNYNIVNKTISDNNLSNYVRKNINLIRREE